MPKINQNSKRILAALGAALLMSVSGFGQGMTKGIMSPPANVRPPGLLNVGIEQHLDEQIPPNLNFRDETGKPVRLGDYFGKKPMILNLVYYNCPMLCGEVLSGLESSLRVLKFDVGKEFDVLTVSFDPRETPDMATKKKAEFLKRYGRAGDHTWTGLLNDRSHPFWVGALRSMLQDDLLKRTSQKQRAKAPAPHDD